MKINYKNHLTIWNKLTVSQQQLLGDAIQEKSYQKDAIIHHGGNDCIGLLSIITGQLRVYMLSDEGKEITLYRLLERDICLFSASCIIKGIDFDVIVEAEQDTKVLHIPPEIYKKLMDESIEIVQYTNELMASRLSDIMWLMDQILYKRLDSRIAAFLLAESQLINSNQIMITHEKIAQHLGSVREVITRMLQYFVQEKLVILTRGKIELLNKDKLELLAFDSLR